MEEAYINVIAENIRNSQEGQEEDADAGKST